MLSQDYCPRSGSGPPSLMCNPGGWLIILMTIDTGVIPYIYALMDLFLRSLHSPTFPIGLHSESKQTTGTNWDSTRSPLGLVHQPTTANCLVPVPIQSQWSPTGIQVVLRIPRTVQVHSTGSVRTNRNCQSIRIKLRVTVVLLSHYY